MLARAEQPRTRTPDHVRSAPRRASPPRAASSDLRSLLAEQRQQTMEMAIGLVLVLAARRHERLQQRRDAAPLLDLEAEKVVLGACLRTGVALPPYLFGDPLHRFIHGAIGTGELAPAGKAWMAPALRGYRRGLMDHVASREALRACVDALQVLAAQRKARVLAERALAVLVRYGAVDEARADLRGAIADLRKAADVMEAGWGGRGEAA